jgi:hypothetical protein
VQIIFLICVYMSVGVGVGVGVCGWVGGCVQQRDGSVAGGAYGRSTGDLDFEASALLPVTKFSTRKVKHCVFFVACW